MNDPLEQLFSRKVYQGKAGEVWMTGQGTAAIFHADLYAYGKVMLTYRELETRKNQAGTGTLMYQLATELLAEASK